MSTNLTCLFEDESLGSISIKAAGIANRATPVWKMNGSRRLISANAPPRKPAMASEKLPTEKFRPSYLTYSLALPSAFRLSYISAESAPEIKLCPIPSIISAIKKAMNPDDNEYIANPVERF